MTVRMGVLDDHRSFGEAISLALSAFDDITAVGVASTIEELVQMVREKVPTVLLVDYQLVEGTGIECAQRIKDQDLDIRLILLTAHASADVTTRALSSGFERVLSKESSLEDIVDAVRSAPSPLLAPPLHGTVSFSKRQREVLELMGQGLDPSSIADQLFISVHTARSHVKDVLRVLGAPTQLAAVTRAIREGYLLPPSKYDVHQ